MTNDHPVSEPEPAIRWYSARLLYRRETGDPAPILVEEKIIVFESEEDVDKIMSKLPLLAKKQEHEYRAKGDEVVRWVFSEILEIQDISAQHIVDGTEVFFRWWENPSGDDWRLLRTSHVEPWWRSVKAGPDPQS